MSQAVSGVNGSNGRSVGGHVSPDVFGRSLRASRLAAGLTSDQLGAQIGASGKSVINWESGGKTPTERYYRALRKRFPDLPAIVPAHDRKRSSADRAAAEPAPTFAPPPPVTGPAIEEPPATLADYGEAIAAMESARDEHRDAVATIEAATQRRDDALVRMKGAAERARRINAALTGERP